MCVANCVVVVVDDKVELVVEFAKQLVEAVA